MLKINSNTKLVISSIDNITDIFDNINDGKDLLCANSWGMVFNGTPEIMEKINCSMYEMCCQTKNFMPWEYGEVRVCHTVYGPASRLPVDVSIFNIAKYLPNHHNNRYRGADQFLLIKIAMTSAAICEVSALIVKRSTMSLVLENHGVYMKMEDEDFVTLFNNIVKNNKSSYSPTISEYERIHNDLACSCIPIKFDRSKLKELEYLNF